MTHSLNSQFMKNNALLALALVMIFAFTGCTGESTSLFDPDYQPERPDPTISVIEPQDGWLAGVEGVVIRGENFSEEADENRVYFDGVPGTVLSSSSSEINVRPAQVTGDDVEVKLTVRGAINFSNSIGYNLDQPVFQAPGSIANDNVLGVATDADGNIFFSYQEGGVPRGIRFWDTDAETTERYLPSQFNWTSLKVGPDGLVYGARNIFGIYRETPNGTIDNNPFAIGTSGEAYVDMDFDPDHNLWAVGNNDNIFRINIDTGDVVPFPFEGNLRAVKYYDGKLYMGGRFDDGSEEGSLEIWTLDVANGEVSNPQQYLDISEITEEDFELFTITFDANGTLFMGTDTGTGIYTWNESDGLEEFYPGLVLPTGYSFAWTDNFLVASATNIEEETRYALKIDVRREGAPYYGVD